MNGPGFASPTLCLLGVLGFLFSPDRPSCLAQAYPAQHWATRAPEQAGMSPEKLDALRDLVGGRGCVARHGFMVYSWGDQSKSSDVASAMKPVLSTLLLMAVQEGRLKSVEEPVAEFDPRLKTLNNGKDAGIT